MTTVTVDEARANLPELLRRIAAGEQLVITDGGTWVAALVQPPVPPPTPEEVAASQARAREAVRRRLQALADERPVLGDGTPIKPYLDRLEYGE